MSLEEYIKLYEKKTGTQFVKNNEFLFCFDEDYGFCEFKVEDSGVYIWNLCGDVKHWVDMAYKKCIQDNLPAISAFILRSPLPFIRLLKFKIDVTENIDGKMRYICHNKAGETLTATQYRDVFIFVWEVKLDV